MCILFLVSCSKAKNDDSKNTSQTPITKTSIKLNTAITITLYDSDDMSIIDACFDLCDDYEEQLSRTIATSEIAKLNESGTTPYQLSETTADLIKKGLEYGKISNGLFDIAIEPLSSLWNFGTSTKRPATEAIEEAVKHVNYENVILEGQTITFKEEGMGIDLGAIAKGYIADRIKDLLLEKGVKSAMINLGGNVLCVGSKPDGSPFNIGIQKPFADRQETIAIMQLSDVSVVSSGIYERYFVEDGITYHHILNPKTGYPIDNNLISVTIISPLSVDGDALSTTVFALGLEDGMELINSIEDTYAIFITDDYKLHYSEGFLDNINLIEE
nr:FAD:protein FMN transferase [Clostridium sp. Marseille-P299]